MLVLHDDSHRLYFPPECQQDCTLLLNQYIWKTFLIFDITINKTQGGQDQIETIKMIMQTSASYHMEGFTNGSGCHFCTEIFDHMKRFRL